MFILQPMDPKSLYLQTIYSKEQNTSSVKAYHPGDSTIPRQGKIKMGVGMRLIIQNNFGFK